MNDNCPTFNSKVRCRSSIFVRYVLVYPPCMAVTDDKYRNSAVFNAPANSRRKWRYALRTNSGEMKINKIAYATRLSLNARKFVNVIQNYRSNGTSTLSVVDRVVTLHTGDRHQLTSGVRAVGGGREKNGSSKRLPRRLCPAIIFRTKSSYIGGCREGRRSRIFRNYLGTYAARGKFPRRSPAVSRERV